MESLREIMEAIRFSRTHKGRIPPPGGTVGKSRIPSRWLVREDVIKQWWNSRSVGVPLWISFAALTAYWIVSVPLPGYAVGALATVAGIMSVREIRTLGRIIWAVLLVFLVLIEFRAIDKDHKDNAKQAITDRNDQDQKFQKVLDDQQHDFQATAQGLEDAYAQSQKQFNTTTKGISKSIDTVTGGTSYLLTDYDHRNGLLFFIHKGEYPVYKALVRIVNLDSTPFDSNGTLMQLQDMTKGHGITEPAPQGLLVNPDRIDLNIFFNSLNGDWMESLRDRRVDETWFRYMRIQGYFYSTNKAVILCEDVEKGFPIETLEKGLRATLEPKPSSCMYSAK